jgi:hypothetical protein
MGLLILSAAFLAATISLIPHSSSQTLQAVECSARLLSPRSATAAVYDGDETVYIFGGWYYDPELELIPYADIHAYNLTSDTIEVVAQLPRTSWDGVTHYDPEFGQIYILRGDGTFLWRYDPSTHETVAVSEWFGNAASIAGAFTRNNKLMTFGGLENPTQVYEYDLSTGEQGTAGELPLKAELSVGIHLPEHNSTYIFAGELGTWDPVVMRYDHSANNTLISKTRFPSWRHGDGQLVWNGKSIFILGAVVDNGARGDGIIEYIPNSNSSGEDFVRFIPLEGLSAELLNDPSAVYVEGLNRIYIFGGYDTQNIDRDEIWYVHL